jgi:hypothetical protein
LRLIAFRDGQILQRYTHSVGVCLISGILFRYHTEPEVPLIRTLPIRLLLWTILGSALLFASPGLSTSITSLSSGAISLTNQVAFVQKPQVAGVECGELSGFVVRASLQEMVGSPGSKR